MNISDLMVKNDTALAICHDLANRARTRSEPLKLSRYARRMRQKVEKMGFRTYNIKDFTEAMEALETLGWGKLIANEKGTITHFKFKRHILSFAKELEKEVPGALEVLTRPLDTPAPQLPKYQLVYILPQGRATLAIEATDLPEAAKSLIKQITASLKLP